MSRIFVCLGFLLLLSSCASLAEQCTEGAYRACVLPSGAAGHQTCGGHRWDDCRSVWSVDGGVLPADAAGTDTGTASGTDSGVLPGTDSGVLPGFDSGISSGVDSGTSSGLDAGSFTVDTGVPTSESAARAACDRSRTGTSTSRLVVTYDEACLDRTFGFCPSGWILTGWDALGCGSPSDPGAGSLAMDHLHRRGGYYQYAVNCGSARFDGWPAVDRNHAVNIACITSARFEDGVELADNEAHFCPGLSDSDSLIVTIPAQPGAIASCP